MLISQGVDGGRRRRARMKVEPVVSYKSIKKKGGIAPRVHLNRLSQSSGTVAVHPRR